MDEQDLGRMNKVLRHRLRNIASGIKSAVNVLRCETEGILPADAMEYFPLIAQKCDELADLTGRMNALFDGTTFNGSGQDSGDTHGAWTKVGELLERLVSDVHSEFPASDVALECSDGAVSAAVSCGPPVLTALREVLVNAVETGRDTEISLACDVHDGFLRFRIADNGGNTLIPDDCEEMFLPFRTTRTCHCGMGLTIARKLIEEGGGTVTARKNKDGGLSVEVRTPCFRMKDANEQKTNKKEGATGKSL